MSAQPIRFRWAAAAVASLCLALGCSTAAQGQGIQCLNRSVITTTETDYSSSDLEIVGTTMFATGSSPSDQPGLLLTYDISDPAAPRFVTSTQLARPIGQIERWDDTMIAAGSRQEIYVFDTSVPGVATTRGAIETNNNIRDIGIDDRFIYAVTSNLIELFDRETLQPLDLAFLPGSETAIELAHGYAYVASSDNLNRGRVYVLDFTQDPADRIIAEISLAGDYIHTFEVAGGFAFVGANDGRLDLLDMADPLSPRLLGTLPVFAKRATDISEIYIADTAAFVCGRGVITRIDLTDPFGLSGVSSFSSPGFARAARLIDGGRLLVSDTLRFTLLDTTRVNRSPFVASAPLVWSPRSISIIGDKAYVRASTPAGFTIYDISDPHDIEPEFSFATGADRANDIAVKDDIVFLAHGNRGLRVVDTTPQPTPFNTLIDTYNPNAFYSRALSVAVTGDTALVAFGQYNLHILDVSRPRFVQHLHTYRPDVRYVSGVMAKDDVAYVTIGGNTSGPLELITIDISDPANPRRLAKYNPPSDIRGVQLSLMQDGRAFAGFYKDDVSDVGFLELDLSDPTRLRTVARYDSALGDGISPRRLIDQNTLVAATSYSDVVLFDVTPGQPPRPIAFYDVPGIGVSVEAKDGVVYTVTADGQLRLIDLSDCPDCDTDLVRDGQLDIDDILAFLTAFYAGDPMADLAPPDGTLDIEDVLTFLNNYDAGCEP